MAFEYGSQKLNIKNPFRFEGLVRSIRGALVVALGVYLLIQIQPLLEVDRTRAWIALALGGFFVLGGLKALGSGLFQVMRFFVGRAAPASLAKNVARESVDEVERALYAAPDLHKMLMNRQNPTFEEPRTWFARAVHTIFPNLLIAPRPVRNLTQLVASKASKTIVALFAYLIASFVLMMAFSGSQSGELGLPIINMGLQLVLLVYLLIVWTGIGQPLSRSNLRENKHYSSRGLGLVIVGSIAIPVFAAWAWQQVWADLRPDEAARALELLPRIEPLVHNGLLLTLATLGAIVTTLLSSIMIRGRIKLLQVRTSSSEKNDSWRFDVHPRQIFTTLRDFVLMKHRELELPNRHYLDANDTAQANRDNEQFNGDMITEIQPVAQDMEEPASMRWARAGGTVLAQILMLVGAGLLWLVAERTLEHTRVLQGMIANNQDSLDLFFQQVATPASSTLAIFIASLLLLSFGRTLARISHVFWAEIFFHSKLFDLHCEGTVMRATHFRGADRHSASSEQDVFSFDATYFALGASMVTSTFAVSGQYNLEQERYVLSFQPDDGFLNGVVADLEEQFYRRGEEIKTEKRADREERLDYIRQEQQARRAGDMEAQGLVASEQRTALESNNGDVLEESPERAQIRRWEGTE